MHQPRTGRYITLSALVVPTAMRTLDERRKRTPNQIHAMAHRGSPSLASCMERHTAALHSQRNATNTGSLLSARSSTGGMARHDQSRHKALGKTMVQRYSAQSQGTDAALLNPRGWRAWRFWLNLSLAGPLFRARRLKANPTWTTTSRAVRHANRIVVRVAFADGAAAWPRPSKARARPGNVTVEWTRASHRMQSRGSVTPVSLDSSARAVKQATSRLLTTSQRKFVPDAVLAKAMNPSRTKKAMSTSARPVRFCTASACTGCTAKSSAAARAAAPPLFGQERRTAGTTSALTLPWRRALLKWYPKGSAPCSSKSSR
mmetsp:Transcript_18560/g.54086  ORF Transcript_18560/g.54086 Transcript_18560/m.54086 type:complete len:317 (-) Transcript_18560:333-1283(-)